MGVQSFDQIIYTSEQAIVDDPLVFQCCYLMLSVVPLLMDLILFRADEGAFVDIWVDLDVRVVAELEVVLCSCKLSVCACMLLRNAAAFVSYPLAVIDRHLGLAQVIIEVRSARKAYVFVL